jgi:hypothetical protein
MSGPIHEAYLRGNLVDVGRENNSRPDQLTPEGFPNSYVRGSCGLYLRVGVHIEAADGSSAQSASTAPQSAASVKGTHLHVVAEPVIAEGGSAFGGPITLRVIENEGRCRESHQPTDFLELFVRPFLNAFLFFFFGFQDSVESSSKPSRKTVVGWNGVQCFSMRDQ